MDERLERRKNLNRGYRKLRTWQMAIELYAFLSEKVKEIPGSPYRLIAQILDAGSSISANIAEGYCRFLPFHLFLPCILSISSPQRSNNHV